MTGIGIFWTIQPVASLERLEREGVLRGRWPSPNDPAWCLAYEWMAWAMVERGIQSAAAPPVWAWHSCRWPGREPDGLTIDALLSEADREQEPVVVTFEAPVALGLLTVYRCWNRVLDGFIRHGSSYVPDAATVAALFDVSRADLCGSDQADDIQASFPHLNYSWVRNVRPVGF